jgi:hypothetical protein
MGAKKSKLPEPSAPQMGTAGHHRRRCAQIVRETITGVITERLGTEALRRKSWMDWVTEQVRASDDMVAAAHKCCDSFVSHRMRMSIEKVNETRRAMAALERDFTAAWTQVQQAGARRIALGETIATREAMYEHIAAQPDADPLDLAQRLVDIADFKRELSNIDTIDADRQCSDARDTVVEYCTAVATRNHWATHTHHAQFKRPHAEDLVPSLRVPVTMWPLMPSAPSDEPPPYQD